MRRQKLNRKKIVIGVTGSFGSGKSTVARIFGSYGAKVIDADRLAHQCIKYKSPAYKRIVCIFGSKILKEDKSIDRKKLGRLVFSNKALLKKLNLIVHPEVISAIKKRIKSAREGLIFLDIPLLLEAGLKNIVDKVIVVKTERAKQLKRIQKKLSLGKPDILKRIKSQMPLPLKIHLADFVIDNSFTLKETKKQVAEIRRNLWKK